MIDYAKQIPPGTVPLVRFPFKDMSVFHHDLPHEPLLNMQGLEPCSECVFVGFRVLEPDKFRY